MPRVGIYQPAVIESGPPSLPHPLPTKQVQYRAPHDRSRPSGPSGETRHLRERWSLHPPGDVAGRDNSHQSAILDDHHSLTVAAQLDQEFLGGRIGSNRVVGFKHLHDLRDTHLTPPVTGNITEALEGDQTPDPLVNEHRKRRDVSRHEIVVKYLLQCQIPKIGRA